MRQLLDNADFVLQVILAGLLLFMAKDLDSERQKIDDYGKSLEKAKGGDPRTILTKVRFLKNAMGLTIMRQDGLLGLSLILAGINGLVHLARMFTTPDETVTT